MKLRCCSSTLRALLLAAGLGACGSGEASRGDPPAAESRAGDAPGAQTPVRESNVEEVALDVAPASPCPEGMVLAASTFCVDRWEISLVDRESGQPLSPYYPPDRRLALQVRDEWEKLRFRMGSKEAQQVPLPPLPSWQQDHDVDPIAVSRGGVIPSAYLSGLMVERACRNAGKRLCTAREWLAACEGEQRRPFPYGKAYRYGACNTFRPVHPAIELHGSPILGHHDPRLDLVKDHEGDLLLRPTGATPACKSEWGNDAIWDMNGNLDEWVDDPHGRLMGAFFARSRKHGCESSIAEHPKAYFDYSTGGRCCAPRIAGRD
ncbi:MAG: SUMF1/EgtB/PvdO family nonheme iron enzyme [Byssovorax sp.]